MPASPNDPALQRALALHQQGRLREAFEGYSAILAREPAHAGALHYSALALHQAGRSSDALPRLERAVALAPAWADAWSNLALVRQQLGDITGAIAAASEATRRAPRDAAVWENSAALLLEAGRPADAARAAETATGMAPGSASAWYNLALARQALGDNVAALTAAERALALAPDALPLHGLAAHLNEENGDRGRARALLQQALRRAPNDAALLFQAASVAERAGDLVAAATGYERVITIADPQGAALSQLLFLRKRMADWHDLDDLRTRFAAGVAAGQRLLSPFCLLSDPSSRAMQRRCAEAWSLAFGSGSSQGTEGAEGVGTARQTCRERLTIGYLSADFHMHATALLMAGLFEHHDRKRFNVVAYSTGPDDQSLLRKRVENAFDRFVDARGWPADRLARQIHADGIDVLVDLKGHTEDARMDVLARRPAPLQVTWLGYPGTTGAPWIDYLIGDPVVTPLAHGADYSETLVQLPGCYQPNDRTREIGVPPDRATLGLPPGAVLCCFNQNYKINPQVFDAWTVILRQVEGSVLWLLARGPADPGVAHLRQEAARRGIAPDRVVFAASRPNADYLALFAHAALFLDTWPYNGHTTASDALWAGCPVVTLQGETFAARVAASVLEAVGLPELITTSVEAYVGLASDLARDPGRCAALRARLAGPGRASALFDIARTTRHVERAYELMWAAKSRGVREPIVVPDD